jgi:hypothetical protein
MKVEKLKNYKLTRTDYKLLREEYEKDLRYKDLTMLRSEMLRLNKDVNGLFKIDVDAETLPYGSKTKIRKARTAINDLRSLFKELKRRFPAQ